MCCVRYFKQPVGWQGTISYNTVGEAIFGKGLTTLLICYLNRKQYTVLYIPNETVYTFRVEFNDPKNILPFQMQSALYYNHIIGTVFSRHKSYLCLRHFQLVIYVTWEKFLFGYKR